VTRIVGTAWSKGASPEAVVEAFEAEAFSVAVLDALLEDPELRAKALAALRGPPAKIGGPTR